MHYVIVGNGVCGMEAALALRRKDAEARITLVSDEHDHFYSRTALMYVFAGQMRLRDTEPYDRGLYERLRFERVRERVAELDAQGKSLRFEGGSTLAYDRLLLAVGSRARPAPWPGAAGPGLHYFVTLRDLEGLDHEAKPGQRAVVVGGGLIGVEVAEILLARGLQVTFVVRENWYFPLALDEREALMVAEHLRAHGVDVRLGVNVEEVRRRPDGAMAGVRDRRRAQHRLPGYERPPPGEGRGDRGGRGAARERSRRVGGGGLRQRDVGRRLAPPGAALVHGARPGSGSGGVDARGRRDLPPWDLVQRGEVLRPRVHDGGLGPRPARLGQHAARSRARPQRLVPALARPLRQPAHRVRGGVWGDRRVPPA